MPLDFLAKLKYSIAVRKKLDLVFFCENLASFLESGINITEAILCLENILDPFIFKNLLSSLKRGLGLSDGMLSCKKTFPQRLIMLVKLGEKTGLLIDILKDFAIQERKKQLILNKIKKALFYPFFVIFICFLILIYAFYFIIPNFANFFNELNTEPPYLTKIMINISNFFINNLFFLVLILFFGFLILVYFSKKLIPKIDSLMWHFRFRKISLIKDSFLILGNLLKLGISLNEALLFTKDTINSLVYRKIWLKIIINCNKGHSFSKAINDAGLLKDTVLFISVMEKNSNLTSGLLKISEQYQIEQENKIDFLANLLEPLMIILAAFFTGFVILSMFLPFIKIAQDLNI